MSLPAGGAGEPPIPGEGLEEQVTKMMDMLRYKYNDANMKLYDEVMKAPIAIIEKLSAKLQEVQAENERLRSKGNRKPPAKRTTTIKKK